MGNFINPIAGEDGKKLASEIQKATESPGCHFENQAKTTTEQVIKWLCGEDMVINKQLSTKILREWTNEENILFLPEKLPPLLKEAIKFLELQSKIQSDSGAFVNVDVSNLSLGDSFMANHRPANLQEESLKRDLCRIIRTRKLNDFWCSIIEPSFEGNPGETYSRYGSCDIFYEDDSGLNITPGDGQLFYRRDCVRMYASVDFRWWEIKAKEFLPEKRSRIGTTEEWKAYSGWLIKQLVNHRGYTVKDAWDIICNEKRRDRYNALQGLFELDSPFIKALEEDCCMYCRGYGIGNYDFYRYPICGIYPVDSHCNLFSAVERGWIVCDTNPSS